MNMKRPVPNARHSVAYVILYFFVLLNPLGAEDPGPDPTDIIRNALNHWRGSSSWAQIEMTIHRPEWERSMQMDSWTKGETDALIRFTGPAKDAGNATL